MSKTILSKSKKNHNILSNMKMVVGLHPHEAFNTNSKHVLKPEQIMILVVLITALITIGIVFSRM